MSRNASELAVTRNRFSFPICLGIVQKEVYQTRFFNLVFNFKQKGRTIVEYTREGHQLNAACPEKFQDVLGHQFIAGLDGKRKVDLVQIYIHGG